MTYTQGKNYRNFQYRFMYSTYQTVFLLLLYFKGSAAVMPQATGQGPLYGLKSYSDVAMFHFIIPKEVTRATWSLGAFMSNENCIPRKAYIHLQWGSYPVITINNATLPPNMYSERNDMITVTTTTTYESETAANVPIDSPEPGDWFIGAYLSPWDKKVEQQGIGYNCYYSIGLIGMWLQENSIESIPVGYKKSMRTKQSSTYYKIFIPSGTSSFRVTVSDCNFTLSNKNSSDLCIKGLALQGRTLPIFNHTHPHLMINLTTNSNYSFIERETYEDHYYYLLVVSDTVIDFNVEISISECPVKIIESNFRYYQVWDKSSQDRSLTLHKNLSDFESENNYVTVHQCPRRFQLIRVKDPKTFSSVHLFQGRESLTPWILLNDIYPVIVQFNILSLVDVGGSLDIKIHIEMDKLKTDQEVTIIACVRRARVPEQINDQIICDNHSMMMNLSSVDRRKGKLLIPYPQPDIWYIATQVQCYSHGYPVICDTKEILVSMNIHTRQCVFSGINPCGDHGSCEEIHQGHLYYTTCRCTGGYKGWGCTDAIDVNFLSSLFLDSIILIISNAFFLPAIYLAIKRKFYAEALVYFTAMLSSSFYHACDQKSMKYCIAKYEVLQYSDFFAGILAFWMTVVAMAQFNSYLISFFHMAGVIIIAICVVTNKRGLSNILIPLSLGLAMLLGNYTYRCYKLKRLKFPRGVFKLCVGLSLVIIGLILYVAFETEANYQFIHSLWHVTIASSLIFLLPTKSNRVKPDIAQVVAKSLNSDSESSSNCLSDSNSSVITVVTPRCLTSAAQI